MNMQAAQTARRGPAIGAVLGTAAGLLFLGALAALAVYVLVVGWDYYLLPRELRADHALDESLRPGGPVGVGLAVLGTALMVVMHVYSVRKLVPRVTWLGPVPSWLQFHIICGVMGPVFILIHTGFLWPRGLVAIAFWCMVLVAASGLFGRYVYGFFPANAAGRVEDLDEARESLALLRERLVAETAGVEDPGIQEAIAQARDLDHRPRSLLGLVPLSFEVWRRGRRIHGLLSATELAPEVRRDAADSLVAQLRLSRSLATWEVAGRMFRLWHVFHLPLAKAMYAIVVVHIFTAIVLGGSIGALLVLLGRA